MLNKLKNIMLNAGEYLLSLKLNNVIDGYWDKTQFKAEADKLMHSFISDRLKESFPDIKIVSEEDEQSFLESRPNKYFLIDPIDGTASFANGFSGFVTQIAYMENGKVEIGVIYAPLTSELFYAKKGNGAYLNNVRLEINQNPKEEILVDNYPEPRGIAKIIYDKFKIPKYIESGSIALKMCRVADNTATIFVKDVQIKDWDIAPAKLIIEEAGGRCCDYMGVEFLFEGSYTKNGVIVSRNKMECLKYAKK